MIYDTGQLKYVQVGWQTGMYIGVNFEKEVFYGNKLKRHAKAWVWSDASALSIYQ